MESTNEKLNAEIAGRQFIAGWNRRGNPPMWPEPKGSFVPATWSFSAATNLLRRSADQVPSHLTERRNLIMVNPHQGNQYPTTKTHVLAYQMVMPGEHARTHRHSPHAGRVVLESEGGYTIVDGVRIPMSPGDVVLTPGMQWHGHGNDGQQPASWVDFLDVPLVQMLEPMFFEPYPGDWQTEERETRNSPLLFPYAETKERLTAVEPDPDGHHGRRVELGDPALPTVGLFMEEIDPATTTAPPRTSANYTYVVIEGAGSSQIDGVDVTWQRGDTVTVPSWRPHQHHSDRGATLLAVTDEPLQRYCGYLHTGLADRQVESAAADPAGYRVG